MTTRPVRIAPRSPDEWDAPTRAALAGASAVHLPAVVAQHAGLLPAYMAWATTVARNGVLDGRAAGLLALRTALRCDSAFEWGVHTAHAPARGLDAADIARVAAGPDASGWSDRDAALVRAVDELIDDHAIGEATWSALARFFGTDELLEIVFVVGHYTMLSMVANTAGVQGEADWSGLP
jgi:4-carboxymuconolactone decarboxylase